MTQKLVKSKSNPDLNKKYGIKKAQRKYICSSAPVEWIEMGKPKIDPIAEKRNQLINDAGSQGILSIGSVTVSIVEGSIYLVVNDDRTCKHLLSRAKALDLAFALQKAAIIS